MDKMQISCNCSVFGQPCNTIVPWCCGYLLCDGEVI